jgi:oligopeptide transport system permease protein
MSTQAPSLSPGRAAWERLLRDRAARVAMLMLVAIALLCVIAPTAYSPTQQDLAAGIQGPSWAHWLGTDVLGRDLLTRLLHGGRVSLLVGFVATLVASIIGVIYGLVSGFIGGKVDALMMRLVDILYAFPFLPFVLLLMALFGRNFVLIFVAIGAVEWLTMARVVRGQVLSLRKQEFVTAARAYGATPITLLWRHLLPNVLGPIVVYASLTIPGVMMLEATLSFLGLGIQPPAASWGSLLREGTDAMQAYPWLLIGPALFFSGTLFALNRLGDALRDAFDPRSLE